MVQMGKYINKCFENQVSDKRSEDRVLKGEKTRQL